MRTKGTSRRIDRAVGIVRRLGTLLRKRELQLEDDGFRPATPARGHRLHDAGAGARSLPSPLMVRRHPGR